MINYEMKDWFVLCIIAAFVLVSLFGIGNCINKDTEKRNQWKKDNPVDAAKSRCYSKIQGSRPACWSEGDWIEFCKRVECKQR
tara:strand:+ start:33 stop:281 length:249 start_codon:yes stop_codon:yes gene_type:complete